MTVHLEGSRPLPPPALPAANGGTDAEEVFVFPASFAQRRLWFLDRLQPGSSTYNIHQTVRLTGRLDVTAFHRALAWIVQRHEALRTTFALLEGEPVQVVAPVIPTPLLCADLRGLGREARETQALALAREEARRCFHLGTGPLLRVTLLRLAEEEHLALLTLHHIISDGWSIGVFLGELAQSYTAFGSGLLPDLPELPFQYADYAEWQRRRLQGEALDELLGYWRRTLDGAPTVLDLPADRPRPAVRSFRGGRRAVALSKNLSGRLVELGRQARATPFMVLLAGFNALLHRLTGQRRILVGTPVANRDQAEAEGLIGFFLNVIVLHAEVSPGGGFSDLLHQVRDSTLEAFAHQDLPFEMLVSELGLERELGVTPLFQVMLALQNAPRRAAELPGLRLQAVDVGTEAARCDLSLSLSLGPDGFGGAAELDLELFDPSTVERLLGHFVNLLAAVAGTPEAPLSGVPLLSEGERHQILVEWNDSAAPAPGTTVPDLFAQQVRRTPEAQALVLGSWSWSYRELHRRAGLVARRLRALGVGPGERVGLFVDRSLELVAGILGILDAGAAFVPLDPSYPKERLLFMVEDSSVRAVLTLSHLEELGGRLARRGQPLLPLDRLTGEAPPAQKAEAVPAGPGDPAYLIYTSGTTGTPKAVLVEHRNLAHTLLGALCELGWREGDRMPCLAPFSFDIFLFELMCPLLSGGTAVLVPLEPVLDLDGLMHLLEEATALHAVPALMRQVVDAARQRGPERYRSLRRLFVGGDRVPAELLADLAATFPESHVRVLYGPTEATIICSSFAVPAGGAAGAPIGRPLPNAVLHLRDAAGQPVPIGAHGEIWIGGGGVTRGYLERPELTAEKFVERDGGRFYRSGDLARWRPDGSLEFLGRLDDQVKIKGFRIELREIEEALAAHPAVHAAVVLARDDVDASGERRLVGYVVAREGESAGGEALRAWLGRRLPEYMVPALFIELESLPLSANGKVDRRALPAPDRGREAEDAYVTPRGGAEEVLARLWAEALGRERVGAADNFFRLGGDSILSLQIVSRARQAGLLITPRQMFEHQTVAALAAVAVQVSPAVAGDEEPAAGEVPLTPVQARFFEELPPDPHHFNQAVMLEVHGAGAGALRRAAGRVLAHHDALRLRFERLADGAWMQRFAPPGEVENLACLDLSKLPLEVRRPAVEQAARALQTSLDLARGPLARAAFFDLGEDSGRLLLVLHHLVVDGVSWRILLEDLQSAVRQAAGGGEVQLPPRTASWKRWAERLVEHARSPEIAAEAGYWLGVPLDGLPDLPVDVLGAGGELDSVEVSLSAEETRVLLSEVPAAYRTQINDVLLSALSAAVEEWTGDGRLYLEMEGHGREEPGEPIDVSRTVGWFTSAWPLLLDTRGVRGPGERLRTVKEQLRAVPGRGFGYGLLRFLGEPETAARLRSLPRPRMTFNYLGQLDQTLPEGALFRPAAESPGPSQSPRAPRPTLIDVLASVAGQRLRLSWTYGAAHRRGTIQALADSFLAALREIAAHCLSREAGGYSPSDFPLAALEQAEIDELLGNRSGIEDVYPLSPLQQGFFFQALYDPLSSVNFEQLALRFEGELDLEAFQRAWQCVVDRHPSLRTGYVWRAAGEPLQIVHRRVEVRFEHLDWSGLSEAEQEAAFRDGMARDRARVLDLAQPPLMRFLMVRLGLRRHRFLWSHHHLLTDGWCLPQVLGEVQQAYRAFRARAEPALPAVRPYRDYIVWLQKQDLEEARAFWRGALAGFEEPTSLGVDRPEAQEAEAFTARSRRLSTRVSHSLRDLARRHRLTLNTLVQGAWAWLLSRYGDSDDVVFGMVVSGRPADLPGVDAIVGLFINTLPLRVRIAPQASLAEWLQGLQAAAVELRRYEHTPLVEIQACSAVPSDRRLFETILAFESAPLKQGESWTDCELSVGESATVAFTGFPVTLMCVPHTEILLGIEMDLRRFDRDVLERLPGHLAAVLESLAAGLDGPVDGLDLMSTAERHQVLIEWNDTGRTGPALPTLAEGVARQAARQPGAPAVRYGERSLTYDELDRGANRLARRLRAAGVRRGARVALCLPRSVEVIVALLAIQKAGAAYVPLDGEQPKLRLAGMLAEAGVSLVLCDGTFSPRLTEVAGDSVPVLSLDAERDLIAAQSAEPPGVEIQPDDVAYVIFTSGSTGTPKGVEIRHRSVSSHAASLAQSVYGSLEGSLQVSLNAPLVFDASVQQIVQLLHGHCLCIVPGDLRRDGEALLAWLARERVQVLDCTPAQLGLLPEPLSRANCPALELVLVGGEAINPELWRTLAAAEGIRFVNVYGPTECTVDATSAAVGAGRGRPVLGRPLDQLRVYVLDHGLRPLPAGVPGEICIAGEGLARGYVRRPELTAERFVPSPFEAGGRLYRTGDRGRLLADGTLEYLGRLDQQVKIRGFRIEPGEIAAALCLHPAVREAVAVARPAPGGGRHLVAYAVPEPGRALPAAAELASFLAERLPEPMIPARFVALEAIPLTVNGKVDRRALPEPETLTGAAQDAPTAPRAPAEEVMAAIWCQVLGLERIGVDDDFFALRGHSLLAAQIIARVRTAFQIDVPLRSLFEEPTVARLCAVVERLQAGDMPAAPALVPAPRDGSLPLSFAQQRLWFLDQLEPGSHAYNMVNAVRLAGRLDLPALHRALNEIVRRHEVLRTSYPAVGEQAAQRIAPAGEVPLPLVDLGSLPADLREPEARAAIAIDSRQPFNLAAGPVLRLVLLRLGAEDHILFCTVHHIAADGWSVSLLIHELTVLYGAFARGGASPLPDLPVQYADYAVWERSWLRGEVLDRHLRFWRRHLGGDLPVLQLPADRPRRPGAPSGRGGRVSAALPEDLAEGVRALARSEGATPFMVLLSAYSVLLHRYAGQEDMVIGIDAATRGRREVENLIGFFINMLVLRVDLRGNPSFRELLGRVREAALGVYSHQSLPFEKLVEELQPQRSTSHAPLFQVVFNFNSAARLADADRDFGMPGLTAKPVEVDYEVVRFDLTLLMSDSGSRLSALWTFNADLFQERTVRRMHLHFQNLLRSAVAGPEQRLEALQMAGEEEQREERQQREALQSSQREKLRRIRSRREGGGA